MSNTLRDLQLTLLDMLKEIDNICKQNNIKYSLACGTALGAIRHHGFIPWDDDLDLMFLRPEYEKFLEIAGPLLKKRGYTLQKEFSDTWPMHYSKVRKDNTAYIERFEPKIKDMHQGIFVDLFPIDNLSDNSIIASAQWNVFHLLVAKEMRKRGYSTNSKKKKLVMAISPLFPEKLMKSFIMQKKRNKTKNVHCFLGGAIVRSHNVFPRKTFNDYINIPFEDGFFPIVKEYDTYLKTCFNDYMQIPPIEKRQASVHAILYDLDKSYKFYRDNINGAKENN